MNSSGEFRILEMNPNPYLISLALVPEYGDQEFYVALPLPAVIHPWVAQNVIPYLGSVPDALFNRLDRSLSQSVLESIWKARAQG